MERRQPQTTSQQKSRSNAAQDQESDKSVSKPKNPEEKQMQVRFDPSKAKGRLPQVSRNGNHPLPKPRKKKEPVRVNSLQQQKNIAVQAKKPQIKAQPKPSLGKSSQKVASTVHVVPKTKHQSVSKEMIQARLKKKSPWFDSIMSPITGGGVKIPDPIGTETGTYQHVENVSVAVNANGVAGLRIVCPYINGTTGGNYPNGFNYQITATDAISTNLAWSAGTIGLNDGLSFKNVPALLKSNARGHRVVSASVLAQPEVSTLQDAGEMCAFVTPFDTHNNVPSYADYQFQYDSTLVPVNTHKPVVARWYPLQASSFVVAVNGTAQGQEFQVSYQDFMDPTSEGQGDALGVVPWEFGVACTGMSASTGVVRFQIVINYEFIPLMSTAMVSAAPSPVDEVEENLVNNWVSDTPITEVVSQKFASQAQQVSRVQEESEPSGLGMLFNIVEEVLPLAKTATKLFI